MWEPEQPPLETILRATLIYLGVYFLLRLAGRKELSRYSSFDLAVIFLLAQAVRRAITVDDPSITSAMIGLVTLIGWDVFLSWVSFRSPLAGKVLKGSPRLLVQDGRPLEEALRASRIGRDELKARLRLYGTEDLAAVERAYLETDGKVSFVLKHPAGLRRA